jgi:hypothetical protein
MMAAVPAFFYTFDNDGVFASHAFIPPNDPLPGWKAVFAALASSGLMGTMPDTLLSKR